MRAGTPPPFQHNLLEWREADITDRSSLSHCFGGVETVVHLAAILANADQELNQSINAEGTRTLIQLCRLNGVNRFIFMSAAAAKFSRTNAYGQSKRKAEEIVADSGIEYAILRAPLILGRGSKEWERFVDFLRKCPGIIPVFGDGKAIKRQVYIEDAVAALAKIAARIPLGNRIWEVACPEKPTLNELIDLICGRLGAPKRKVHIPLRLSLGLASMAELVLGSRSPVTCDIILGLCESVDF